MNIVFVAPRSWPAVGGMESYLRDLARALAERHEVTVLAQGLDSGPRGVLADSLRPPAAFAAFADGRVRVEPLRLPPARRALLAPLASQVVPGLRRYAYGRVRHGTTWLYAHALAPVIAERARGADLIHMWGGGLLGGAALHAARLLGVPYITTPFAHRRQWGDDRAAAATYRAADRVLGLLEADAGLYRELGVASERVEVVGVCSPGVETGGGAAVRSANGIDGPLVLFLGVRRPYKGYEILLEAAAIIGASRPDVTFAFAGPGDPVPVGAGGARVLDLGELDERGRAAWLEAADLLCLPSAGEIFPVTILEAWSAGTAVLTSDIPPLAELVGASGGGATAAREPDALAAAILRALDDPARLRSRAAAGHQFWRERFTVGAVAARHERIYASVTGLESVCAA